MNPVTEYWILVQKPLGAKTYIDNVLAYGVGGLNIGANLVKTSDNLNGGAYQAKTPGGTNEGWRMRRGGAGEYKQPEGRYPAHLLLSHSPDCEPCGGEPVPAWNCVPGCPVALMDAQSGISTTSKPGTVFRRKEHATTSMAGTLGGPRNEAETAYGDTGGASRFFTILDNEFNQKEQTTMPNVQLLNGDSVEQLQAFPANYFDSLVTDPPAGIAFMGKKWDEDKGGRDAWIAWISTIFAECYRTLKPGGYGFVWAIPRTSHWTMTALENVGFQVVDVVSHVFGQGFPKGLNIAKALDKRAGVKPVDVVEPDFGYATAEGWNEINNRLIMPEPQTEQARKWEGWNTALKPACEFWILVQKPLGEKTYIDNILKHGVGGLNIAANRVTTGDNLNGGAYSGGTHKGHVTNKPGSKRLEPGDYEQPAGRYPAHLVLSHSAECKLIGEKQVKGDKRGTTGGKEQVQPPGKHGVYSVFAEDVLTPAYGNADGLETVEAWACADGCPVKELDTQSGITKSSNQGHLGKGTGGWWRKSSGKPCGPTHGDTGGASRFFTNLPAANGEYPPFFYSPKASQAEKNRGCENLPEKQTKGGGGLHSEELGGKYGSIKAPARNHHPTPKSLKLMRWLIRLVTPPGGTVLDAFGGTFSTAVAAVEEGFNAVAVEKDTEEGYFPIGVARVRYALRQTGGVLTYTQAGADQVTEVFDKPESAALEGPSAALDGTAPAEMWQCAGGCPVKELDTQSGISKSAGGNGEALKGRAFFGGGAANIADGPNGFGFGDTGGASRFFTNLAPDTLESAEPVEDKPSEPAKKGKAHLPGCVQAQQTTLLGTADGPAIWICADGCPHYKKGKK